LPLIINNRIPEYSSTEVQGTDNVKAIYIYCETSYATQRSKIRLYEHYLTFSDLQLP